MQIIISGRSYNVDSLKRASLTDLLNLKRHTGLALKDIQDGISRLDGYENAINALGDMEALMAMGAMIWLARWKAGDGLDFEAACDFPLEELEFVRDPGDEPEPGDQDAEKPSDADPSV